MQTKIVLNPAYKGPIVIEEYLRKMKSKSGLGRMISNFNKRLFIIDFRHMRFYYLPERGAQLSSATDIPFESITRVYIDNQLQMLDDDQIWKHGFVILSGKRSYRLISYSRNNMENILYALGHLINTATGKPLFDWNEYKQIQDSNPTRGTEPVRPMIFSPPGEEKEKEIEAQAVEKPKSRTGSDEIKGEVRKESLKKAPEDPENGREVRASNTERQEAEEFQERPDRRIEQEREEESRREEKAKAYRMRDEEKNEERVKEKKMMRSEVENADVCESRIVTGEESVAEQREKKVKRFDAEEREEPKERKVGSVRAKVEVLTIDSGENVIPIGRSNASYSVKNNSQAGRDNNMWEQKSITPKNPYGGRPLAKAKRSSEEEIGSNRVNEVEEERNQANRNYMQQNEQEQVEGFGKPKEKNAWGAEESQPKKVEVTNVKKNVVEDDDWDKDMESPPKKSTKKAEVKVNGWGNEAPAKKETAGNDNWDQPKNRSVPSHVKDNMVKKVQDDDDDWDKDMESPPKKSTKKAEVKVNGWGNEAPAKKEAAGYDDWDQPKNRSVPSHVKESVVKKVQADDDWDNDMFDGSNKSKRLDVRSEYKNATENSNYSAVGGFGKAPKTVEYAATKQTEVPAARGKVHNDWDDDL